jgi:hypothetical protein
MSESIIDGSNRSSTLLRCGEPRTKTFVATLSGRSVASGEVRGVCAWARGSETPRTRAVDRRIARVRRICMEKKGTLANRTRGSGPRPDGRHRFTNPYVILGSSEVGTTFGSERVGSTFLHTSVT